MTKFVLRMTDIVKEFPGVIALDGACLSIKAGEIHGLVGENGAGKSTIIKVLAGVYKAEAGSVEIDSEKIDLVTPLSVHDSGVRFIHQELHLVPHFTVAESVFTAQEISTWRGLAKREMRNKAEAFLGDRLGVSIPGNRLIRNLSTAERKLVQIARALIDDKAKLVVFDEPTAPLASEDVETVMRAIEQLQSSGISILYVSHYLDEITNICDRVTVFRHGKDVGVFDTITKDSSPALISKMVGRDLGSLYPQGQRTIGEPTLELRDFELDGAFKNIALSAKRGEILGIAGLIGSGREELIDCIYGLKHASHGSLMLSGKQVQSKSPAEAVQNGIVLVPRDRRQDGLVLPMTVMENTTLASLEKTSVYGLEHKQKALDLTNEQIEKLDIRPTNPDAITRFLSGGNQQKVVLARWLAKQAKIFILDEPTVGVDVGAKVEIYQLIEDLAAGGATVIISSSDPAELIGTCDRIVVLMRGEISQVINTQGLNVDYLVAATTGAASASGAQT